MSIHFDASRMAEIRDTYERWWKGELNRPLVHGTIYDAYAPSHTSKAPLLSQQTCTDLSWTPEELIDALDARFSQIEYIGDGFPYLNMDVFGPGVAAAFCGAKLDNSSGQVWFFPPEKREISEIHIRYDPDNIWVQRIKDIYRAALNRWNDSVMLGMPDYGGIMDIIASFSTTEELLYALIDEPEEVHRLVSEAQTAWYDAYHDFEQFWKPQNGYTDLAGLFSATPSYILQCDFSYMISNDMFREFTLEAIREDTKRLKHTIYHLDGVGALQHLDSLLSLPDLKAVQWVQGSGKPGPMHWLDIYRKITDAGKQYMMVASPQEFIDVVDVLHGSPYTLQSFSEKERDLAMKVVNAR